MKKTLLGSTLFEVLIYLGIFSLMAIAIFSFSWNVLDLGTKDRTERQVFSDARRVSERLEYLIRNSAGIDQEASVFDDANGKIVLNELGSNDTVSLFIQDGRVVVEESNQSAVALHSTDVRAEELRFTQYGTQSDASEYVGFTLTLRSSNSDTRSQYTATTTLRSGVFIRNSGI